MRFNVVEIIAAICFLSTAESALLSPQDQLQVALQKVAELKGNGTFQSCCNVSPIYSHHLVQITYRIHETSKMVPGVQLQTAVSA